MLNCFVSRAFLLLLCIFAPQFSAALKILMYQTAYSPSHMGFSGTLVDILTQAGHTVDKLIMEFNPNVESNGSTRLRHVYRIQLSGDNPFMNLKHMTHPFEHFNFLPDQGYHHTKNMLCEALTSNTKLIKRLKDEKYDIYLTAAYEGCTFGLYHVLQIPSMVGFIATPLMDGVFEMLGIPVPPSFVTSSMGARPGDRDQLSFQRRVENFIKAVEDALNPRHHGPEQAIFEKHYPGFPTIQSIASKMSYLFLNTDEIIDITKPISPKVKFIGGIAMKKPKELSQEFENILSMPSKGVILFSFGSLIKTTRIPLSTKVEILNAFKEFTDYTVLWKYDDIEADADLLRNYSNVFTKKWMPQTELLHDSRVKVFMTHMGLNSYLEVSHAGVPVIGIPVFADQFYNTGCAEKNGVGVQLDKTRLTKEVIVAALREILDNPSYTQNAKEIARLLAKKPEKITPEKFAQYIEYAAEFPSIGPEVFQLASANMNLLTFLSLDVVLFLLICTVFFVTLFVIVAKLAISFVRRKFLAKVGHEKIQ